MNSRAPKPHQVLAIYAMKPGKVLVGGTGSGKSFVSLCSFSLLSGGSLDPLSIPSSHKQLYIITTPKKRDTNDWEREALFIPGLKIEKIDSWNNIKKYTKVKNAFFIFDEQRVSGKGAWARSFLKITKHNDWFLLSATPADKWEDLIPVFVANGFYRNRTEFAREHIIYAPYTKYPRVVGYRNEIKLEILRHKLYVIMKHYVGESVTKIIPVSYDENAVKEVLKKEWNPFLDRPIRTAPEQVSVVRKIINSDSSRLDALETLHKAFKKIIVFYNFDYELALLKDRFEDYAEYNGHVHEPIPTGDNWLYFIQYMAGNEGWECFETNVMVFYSLNYSYRITKQAEGRIKRLNSNFKNFLYFRFVSSNSLDKAILKCIEEKRNFNEKAFVFDPRE